MATPQEITAAYYAAEKRLLAKGGKLRNTPANASLITGYVIQNGLQYTEENIYQAFNGCLRQLDWEIKPPKLVAIEANEQQTIIPEHANLVDGVAEDEFVAKVLVGEKADADSKEHSALVAQCTEIIAGYLPTKHTRSGSAYDNREREDMQAHWTRELDKAKTKSVEAMRNFTKSLATARANRYSDRERASERM
jgi:uncharacterized protein YycO